MSTFGFIYLDQWVFAALVGELFGGFNDPNIVPHGCFNLWPRCPLTTEQIVRYRVLFQT